MELADERKNRIMTRVLEITLLALSFVLPVLMIMVLMANNGISLFAYDDKTIIMSDMQSQYIAYLRSYRDILLNGGSFIYTTEKVFGGDYMSLFTYYLGSPFNLLVVFCSEEGLPLFFLWTAIIKMGLASFNLYLFVRVIGKFNITKLIPALGYGLISYSFVYMFNFMWLDGVMILPLVALGMHLLKQRKHIYLYPLAIAYSLMTSWYIGFMVCVFAVLYFVYLFFSDFTFKKAKENGLFALRFALFSLAGGLLVAVFWLTAFLHLGGTKAVTSLPNDKWYSATMFLAGLLENNYPQYGLISQYNSYITMFVGIVPLAMAIMFFCAKEIKWQEKAGMACIVIFYVVFSLNSVLTALLHGGREPTFFPGRYSFIIGFVICYLAARAIEHIHKIHPLFYLIPIGAGIAVLIVVANVSHSEKMESYPISTGSAIMYFVTVAFMATIAFLNQVKFKKPKLESFKKVLPYASALLIIVQAFSLYRGNDTALKTNLGGNAYQNYSTYLSDCEYDASFKAVKEYETKHGNAPFYRMEATFNRPGNQNLIDNNPMFYSYSGLSNFSSSSKQSVDEYLLKLGFQYNHFFAKYDGGSTYAINSLLGIKYLLEDRSSRHNIHPTFLDCNTFEQLFLEGKEGVTYYRNPQAVSLAFSSDKTTSYFINEGRKLSSSYTYWFDHFEYQNEMFKTMDRSIGKNIFNPLEITSFQTSISYREDEAGLKRYSSVKNGDTITIKFKVPEEGYGYPLYFAEKNQTGDISYTIDGKSYEVNTYWHKGIYSFPDNPAHTHTLTIRFKKNFASLNLRPELYYEDLPVTREYLTSAKSQELRLTSVENNLGTREYKGKLNIQNNNKELIFTLPYEDGIHVYVDGKEAEIAKKWNIFTSLDLSAYSLGEHDVTIAYKDSYLLMAFPVSIVSMGGFIPMVFFYLKAEKRLFRRKEEEDLVD